MLQLVFGSLGAVIVLTLILIIKVKVRKKKEELRRINDDKKRLDDLDKKILNTANMSRNYGVHANTAYEAKYYSTSNVKGKRQYLLRLEEVTGLSSHKYVFNSDETVTIGSKTDNSIVIRGQDVGNLRIQFAFIKDEPKTVYICNIGQSESASVVHKRKNIKLSQGKKIKIHNGDSIVIGSERFKISFVKV